MNDSKAIGLQIVELLLYAVGFAGLFAALLLVTYYPPDRGGETLSAYILGALSAVGGVVLGHKRASRHRAPPAGDKLQGGRVSLPFLALLVYAFVGAFIASMLTGCAGLNAQGALTITYNTPPTVTTSTFAPGGVAAALAPLLPLPAASAPAAPASAAK